MLPLSYHVQPPGGTQVRLSEVPLGEWYPFFMQWQVPVGVSVIYTILSFYFNPSKDSLSRVEAKRRNVSAGGKPPVKSLWEPMTMVVFFHNAILAAYSAWAFRSVFPLFARNIAAKGWHCGLCDLDGAVWNGGLFVHMYLFYLSKFYELIDTAIIIAKGRKASLLQIYHHAGVILTSYYGCYYASSATVFLVWENTGVHTIMYLYYALTAIGISPPGKQYLTSLQIFQFLFGQSFIIFYLLKPACQTASQRTWLWIMTAYLLPLIYLFVQFFSKTYKKDAKPKKDQ
ncbi:hypothetical protein GGH91_003264 [Coemansia sp. RSA 2671]|uniref:Elongation of fatty acids protein n=2 Tax=Coemansia TaxID=4863 RepID=A0A9W8GHE6_9FUNG|nr:hypothetical protein LPJ60_001632 [Coemansia sp. RSA 2675]KAJ2019344.1 hypothetical protein GGI06_002548 [Coemansia sp. S85]KAJ2343222.1 hypothetical protein GGH91_003264 [Coemansia sp. RSA 2671]KAJ2416753.1 hypothetical protein GGI10_000742 [Coemansia sp. RSA 2530]KAJ2685976.1 hypothetical protein IWW39_003927 [Coemansia spiralis]KAJ2703270.1 hypothetical protein H4218_000352 [Coemansia sp. IMI 209128]KAJ2789588.1 hypothetical protein GGI18_002311 [Coemansia linderi]